MNHHIVGSSEATSRLHRLMLSVAPTDASVLIRGESGCGKELYARTIHENSSRKGKPFIAVNCGAIPSELLESQLFGHKKGAFTGAIADFKGKFQEADGGTLFLDEIGDMPFEMQVKLLRVLQERNLTPIGSHQIIEVDTRIIAATHQNIEQSIEEKAFREDLFFRLNVVPLTIPPLRDRKSEIPELINHFSDFYTSEGRSKINLQPKLMRAMTEYNWPGNVRELANTIHRFSILYPGSPLDISDIDPTMLPAGFIQEEMSMDAAALNINGEPSSKEENTLFSRDISDRVDPEFEDIVLLAQGFKTDIQDFSLKDRLASYEQDIISKALSESGGNVSRCAKLLKMQRTTLIERIKKFDLQS